MADGGFAVKFDGKVVKRCYAVAFDYDRGEVKYNFDDPVPFPVKLKTITIELEKNGC